MSFLLNELQARQSAGQPIRVGLIGAGAMGRGIAWQISRTPGMKLAFIADIDLAAADHSRSVCADKSVPTYADPVAALENDRLSIDVVVEATNTIGPAARYCLKAIERRAHVVLMNAEVDLVVGRYLQQEATRQGVVVTSDAGDQHGVLARMLEEAQLWGFEIVQAGNIKGLLDRYATAEAKRDIAKQLGLSLVQCVAYTDGTKLNIEMSLLANGFGLTPIVPGMEGPRAHNVTEALELFDFDSYDGRGRIDYLLGSKPGGGVYVIGKCDDPGQAEYLKYYKVHSRFPYYLLYRPYHLCHIETPPRAVAMAALWQSPVLSPRFGQLTDVYTYAKQPIAAETELLHGIGGDYTYGLVHTSVEAEPREMLPIGLLEPESGLPFPRVTRNVAIDEPITCGDVELPDSFLLNVFHRQQ